MKQILIVEDNRALANGIMLALQNNDIMVDKCFDISSGRNVLASKDFDLLILDVNLPDGNGVDFMQEVKRQYQISVILLTANDLEIDIVNGLELGADDYITKPFSLAVLRARVNAQLRKYNSQATYRYEFGCYSFDFNRMEFKKNSVAIELSKTEQRLLKILIENRGITLSRSVLSEYLWADGIEYVDENSLSVTIKRLRDKLEDNPSTPQFIKTVYGIGYTWVVEK